MKHSEWLAQATENAPVLSVARKIGAKQRTLAYQVEKEKISPENVIAIAIAYDAHPVGALVETGYLDERWGEQIDPKLALRIVSEEDLCDEVLRRMKLPGGVELLDKPVDELATRRRPDIMDVDALAASEYAADTSPDEQALMEERGEYWEE